MADNQVRVILWSIPRTVSTAFVKCMSNLADVQVINEPYLSTYVVGPDMKHPSREDLQEILKIFVNKSKEVKLKYDGGWDTDNATYKFVKESLLEAEYPGKKVVFVKDMSYAVTWKLHMLPQGYRHAFLIRHPAKVFSSWKKMYNTFTPDNEVIIENDGVFIPKKYAFGESLQLYEHLIKTGIDPDPFIIDTDDLLENPELILKQFCERTRIQYTDKLLKWNAGDGIIQEWKASNVFVQGNELFGFYKNAFDSQHFYKPTPVPGRSELPDDVNACVDGALPYYEKMYTLRLRAEKINE
ncbi:branched-chain-amino-acid aminotransferase-like protein 1 [Anneissia japonica]|uniref:branched-chain-amino-acid aminotransferase-like protein 1 n=1 Tax=Anneissia japonica TaxID=1529436 RepID=UPI00142572F4|nr:branched-chain-amino-acid aminotransferase-like protein 1 [Anneissia japonica]